MPNFVGTLAALSGLPQGWMDAQRFNQQQAEQQALLELNKLRMQEVARQRLQEQQQAKLAFGAAQNLFGQPQQPMVPQQQQPMAPSGGMNLPAAPSYGPSGGMPTDAQLDLARRAMAQGYPPAAAAGMAGSMTGESGRNLDPYALNPRSGALGEAQWLGPRKAALLSRPNPLSRETQTGFLFDELRGPEASTGQRLMSATDPAQAARDFTTGFERPGNVNMAPREQAARAVYAQLSPDQQMQAQDAAVSTAAAIPPQMAGRLTISQLAQAINRQAGPEVSDEAKFGALVALSKLAMPEQQAQLEQAWKVYGAQEHAREFGITQGEKAREFGIREKEVGAQHEFNRELAIQRLRDQEGGIVGAPIQIGNEFVAPTRSGQMKKLQLPEGVSVDAQNQPHRIGTAQQGGSLTDSQADFWSRVLQGGGALPPGAGRNRQDVGKIMQRVGDTGDPAAFVANRSAVKSDTASLQSLTRIRDAVVSYERTALRNFDLALDKVKDVPMSDWGPWLNRWARDGSTAFGGEAVPAYAAALVTAANEYAKILSGSTGAQAATDSSRRETADLISQYFSSGQINEVVNVAKQEMHNREIELNSQIGAIEERIKGRVSGEPTSTGPSTGQSSGALKPTLRYNPDSGKLEPIQ